MDLGRFNVLSRLPCPWHLDHLILCEDGLRRNHLRSEMKRPRLGCTSGIACELESCIRIGKEDNELFAVGAHGVIWA
jgi:hypothetical protein